MDNQNDVALANTVDGRGLRVGEANVGAFVGSTLVAGKEFDIEQLINNITFSNNFTNSTNNVGRILIANFSNSDKIALYRSAQKVTIPKQHIEWYSYNIGEEFYAVNEGDITVIGFIQYFNQVGSNLNTEYIYNSYAYSQYITDSIIDYSRVYNIVCILMNECYCLRKQ